MDENKVIEFPIEEQENQTLMDEMASIMDNSGFSFDEFASFLSLPDEQFNVLSELILDELQKAMNNPADRILIQEELQKLDNKKYLVTKIEPFNQNNAPYIMIINLKH